jgi:hypothetical protein
MESSHIVLIVGLWSYGEISMNRYMGDFGYVPMPSDKLEREEAKYQLQKVQVILSFITASLLVYNFLLRKK